MRTSVSCKICASSSVLMSSPPMESLNGNEQLSTIESRSVVYSTEDGRIQFAVSSRRTIPAPLTIAHLNRATQTRNRVAPDGGRDLPRHFQARVLLTPVVVGRLADRGLP